MATMKRSGVIITRVDAGLYTSSNGYTIWHRHNPFKRQTEWVIFETAVGATHPTSVVQSYAGARSKVCFQLPDATKGN